MYESLRGMVENAIGQVNKWGQIEAWEEFTGVKGDDARRWMLGEDNDDENDGNNNNSTSQKQQQHVGEDESTSERKILTHNEIIRRRRLAAFRWTMTLTTSYFLYRGVRRLIRMLLGSPRGNGRQQINSMQQQQQYYGGGRMSNQYYGDGGMGSGYGMNRYSSYGGGGYGRHSYSSGYDMGGGDYY